MTSAGYRSSTSVLFYRRRMYPDKEMWLDNISILIQKYIYPSIITRKHIHLGSVLQSEQLNATTWLLQASAAATAVLQSAAIIQDNCRPAHSALIISPLWRRTSYCSFFSVLLQIRIEEGGDLVLVSAHCWVETVGMSVWGAGVHLAPLSRAWKLETKVKRKFAKISRLRRRLLLGTSPGWKCLHI